MLRNCSQQRPLRVLWLIDSLTLGGAEALTLTFVRSVDRKRVQVHVACLRSLGGNPIAATLRAEGVTVTDLGSRHLRDVAAFRRLHRLVRRERFDLVHAHLAYASIWGLLAGRAAGVPVVVTLHVAPSSGPLLSRGRMRENLLAWFANRWASRVIFVSVALLDAWRRIGRLDLRKAVVVHNGVDCDTYGATDRREARARIRWELGISRSATLVTTVSVLRPGKGVDILLEAIGQILKGLPGVDFIIVGDGPSYAELRARCRALALDSRVHWLGMRRDVPILLAASDLFILPSLYDAFPTALLEAMATGLPAVATRTGGIPEIMTVADVGRLVRPGDAAALVSATLELLENGARQRAIGTAARRHVRAKFSATGWAGQLVKIYTGCLKVAGATT